MKLIDGSILRYKEDGDTWIHCKGKEINVRKPVTNRSTGILYSEVVKYPEIWDLFWLPEGLL